MTKTIIHSFSLVLKQTGFNIVAHLRIYSYHEL